MPKVTLGGGYSDQNAEVEGQEELPFDEEQHETGEEGEDTVERATDGSVTYPDAEAKPQRRVKRDK